MSVKKTYLFDPLALYYICLSGDTKPTAATFGSLLLETDTRKEWIFGSTGGWALKQKFST